MRVKGVIEEDFLNFREPAMFINTCFCDFKCCTESGLDVGVCQNPSPRLQSRTFQTMFCFNTSWGTQSQKQSSSAALSLSCR